MAGSMTNAGAKKVLDYVFRDTSMALDATNLWVGLMTAAADPEASSFTEVTGGSYARQAVARTGAGWDAATTADPSATGNTNAINFPTATASWGTVTHFGIFDAVSAGNLLFWGDLTISKTIDSGDTATFAASAITVTLD